MHPYLNHHFFEHHGGAATPPLLFRLLAELFESSLLRTSWVGLPPPPPNPPATVVSSFFFKLFFTGIEMPSYLNHHFCCPRQPASYCFDSVTHDLLVMLGMFGHAGDVEHDAGDVGGLV